VQCCDESQQVDPAAHDNNPEMPQMIPGTARYCHRVNRVQFNSVLFISEESS
jgi:hypothetical protein